MLDTQGIYEDRRYISERQQEAAECECEHPAKKLWPFWPGWHICTKCGAVIRPADFIPFLPEETMTYYTVYR